MNPGLVSYICEFIDNSRKTPMAADATDNKIEPCPERGQREVTTLSAYPEGPEHHPACMSLEYPEGPGGGGGSSPYHYKETVVSRYSQAEQKGGFIDHLLESTQTI